MAAPVELREPDPWPQGDIRTHLDYDEAKQLLNKHKWDEAAIVLRSLQKKNPDFFPGAIELARALVYSGRREEALGVLSQAATRQVGDRKTAVLTRGRVISRLFLTQKCFQTYQDGLNLLASQKYRAARERFEKALEQEPDNVEILTRVGQCLILEGDFDSAAERLRLAKRLNPYEPEIRLWLGRAMHQRGELTESLAELKFAHGSLETSERAPIWYAEALMSAGQRKAAVHVLEDDTHAQPFHLMAIVALSRMRTQLFQDGGGDSLWNARKDLQVAQSRLPKYATGDLPRFEGEMGVEFRTPAADLKSEITTLLSQLDGRLKTPSQQNSTR
jgi:Flp pilus assembly protein TadD